MLQYAPLDESFGSMKATGGDIGRSHESGRRRRRREEADEAPEAPTPDRIILPEPVPERTLQSSPSALDAIHPDIIRILPYACLLFFIIVIMMMVEMKGNLAQIKELLARERLFHTRPFLRG